ncbi:MAG TPA: tetraacyldisaccharide 4'-kinase [Blastocatellia bacterium]|jgi:tetraacyldisaccharide 4'-kinase|nr:tetraacyldisaccharide 4'-kinase [Blastocatellia bacterium]
MIEKHEKFKRAMLWLPAKLYELAVRLRVAAYETEYRKQKRLDAVVISVGNIALGGTGKTPMVEYIARYIKSEDHSVAILTRGYARESSGMRVLNDPRDFSSAGPNSPASVDERSQPPHLADAPNADDAGSRDGVQVAGAANVSSHREYGDEPLMLARALPGVPVIINKNRYEGGLWAERELGAEVLVLDDAYQHLGLARDLNILLLDATDPFGGFEMAPFGRLREPLYGIKRADAIIITRADRPFDQGQTGAIIKFFCGDKVPVMYVYSSITRLRHLETGAVYEAGQFAGWNAAVMCGIGNPRAFSDDILQFGMNIVNENFFPDHHAFTQEDVERVTKAARETGADAIVTTEKDAVRLESLRHGDVPVYAAQLEIQSEDEVRLKSLLLRTLIKK